MDRMSPPVERFAERVNGILDAVDQLVIAAAGLLEWLREHDLDKVSEEEEQICGQVKKSIKNLEKATEG